MKACQNCGTENEDNSKFCQSCGKHIDNRQNGNRGQTPMRCTLCGHEGTQIFIQMKEN